MKKVRYKFLVVLSWLLGSIASFLGCGDPFPVADYGVPSFPLTVNGTIKNSQDSSAIMGIQVCVLEYTSFLALSDSSGCYQLGPESFSDLVFFLSAMDIDGELNGSFSNAETKIAIDSIPSEGVELEVNLFLDPVE